jgi:hypothetical protein
MKFKSEDSCDLTEQMSYWQESIQEGIHEIRVIFKEMTKKQFNLWSIEHLFLPFR